MFLTNSRLLNGTQNRERRYIFLTCHKRYTVHIILCSYEARFPIYRTSQSVLYHTLVQNCSFRHQLILLNEAFDHAAIIARRLFTHSSTTVYNCTHLSSCVSWGVVDRTQLPKLGNGHKRNIDNNHTARNLPTNTQWTDIINITSATFILFQDDRPLRTNYSY